MPYQSGVALYIENEGDEKSGHGFSQQGNLGLPIFSQNYHSSRIPPRDNKFGSRLGSSKSEGYKRMEIVHRGIQNDLSDQENTRHRYICLKNISPASPIHVLETRPLQQRPGCFSNQLESNLHMRFPSFALIGRVLQKVQQDQTLMITITPAWQTQTWFQRLLQKSVKNPLLLPQKQDLPKYPAGKNRPLIYA